MSGATGTLQRLAAHLARAVEPLDRSFRDEQAFAALMRWIGWDVDGLPPSYAAVADAAADAVQALDALADDAEPAEVLDVVAKAGAVYRAVEDLHDTPAGVDPAQFLPDLPRRLLEYLLAQQLLAEAPGWFSALEALGVIALEDNPPAGGRRGYTRVRFDWDQLPATLADPASLPARLYGWGTGELDFAALAEVLGELLSGLGLPSSLDRLSAEESAAIQAGATGEPAAPARQALTMVLFDTPVDGTPAEVGIMAAELPAEGTAKPGVILQPMVPDGIDPSVDLGGGWVFVVRSGTDLGEQLGVVIRPQGVSVRYPYAPGGTELPDGGFGISMAYDAGEPAALLGRPGGSRLELSSAEVGMGLGTVAGELELTADVAVSGLAFVLSAADLDGFLGGALGGAELRIELTFGISWSSRTGLDFLAGAGFAWSLYPHLDFGVLSFDRVDLAVRFVTGPPASLALEAAASFSGELGPISYAVDRAGVQLPVLFDGGNAGPFDVRLGPLWPTGLGLLLDAGVVTGGGFVSFDELTGRYVGAVELDLFGVGIGLIGILDTKDAAGDPLPPPGFSFLIIVSVELPPIQLGFGFTLNGVGGLAAVHRRLATDALLDGVREGSIDDLMFPADPVEDAPRIASDLSGIFPVAMDRYVFGPMVIIGWGTPTLIEVELGVVVEVPDPVVIALIGTASATLPSEDVAIVSLNLDVVGVLDLGQSLIAVDASLRDSYVAGFTLAGDLAMRLYFGSDPSFALAVGGMNPHFTDAPPGFPELRRVSISLGLGDNPRISLEGYFAVTSNSLQFGSRAELYVEEAGFSVLGWVSLDVLVTFRPFAFRFDFSAGMTLNRGDTRIAGITIDGHLTGPSPFHAWGSGAVSVLFVDVRVPFDATFGESEQPAELAPADPWPPLEAALELGENWSAELPVETVPGVTLLTPSGTDTLLLHPMGEATVRQKVVPLNRTLERFGEYAISGPDRFDVTGVRVGDRPASSWDVVTDHFSPGEFEQLTETEKLSRDSFEMMDAGVGVGGDLLDAPTAALKTATLDYETKIVDAPWISRKLPAYRLVRDVQLTLGLTGSKATSLLATTGTTQFARTRARPAGVTIAPERYTVATQDTLAARPDLAAGVTKGAASLALKHAPEGTAAGLQVVPEHELEPVGSGARTGGRRREPPPGGTRRPRREGGG
ncbi:MAG TPA: DUF6603 domain-containing protein [Actinomycetes bacterium]|nr:DUF6603 domain-containing protein [Actinomycetes bacterium]